MERHSLQIKKQGFTLFELLVSLSLVLIFSIIGIPLLQSTFSQIKSYTVMSDLHHALHFAKMQAISSGKPVHICPSVDGENCTQDWSHGYMIYLGEAFAQKPEQILKIQQLNLPPTTLKLQAFPDNHFFTFMPSGTSHHANGTFSYCSAGNSRSIVVNKAGRIRAERGANC